MTRPAVVVVAVAAALVAASCGTPNPSDRPVTIAPTATALPEPSSPGATSTPGPTPVGPTGLTWTEIDLAPAAFEGARVGTVVAGGPGLVAFGRAGNAGAPVTWTSSDGEHWTRHDQSALTFGGAVPTAVVHGPAGVVAVGTLASPDGPAAEIWLSPDGATWRRDPSGTGRFGPGETIVDLASSSTAIVASGGDGYRSFALRSSDGEHWVEIPDDRSALGRDPNFHTVVGWGSGFLASGTVDAGAAGGIWTSPDGWTWTPSSLPANTCCQMMVFALRDGYLATGLALDETATSVEAAWRSEDGLAWQPTSRGPSSGSLVEVVPLADGDVGLLGMYDEGETGYREELVVSGDARRWAFVEPPSSDAASAWSHRIVGFRDRLLAFSSGPGARGTRAWWGDLTGLAPAAPRDAGASPTPTPSETPVPGPGASPDLVWRRLEDRSGLFGGLLTRSELTEVEAFNNGWFALGNAGDGVNAFWSPDALRWERATPSAAFGPGIVAAAAVRRGVAVAVGTRMGQDYSPAEGVVWRSTDGRRWTRSPASRALKNAELRDVVATDDGFLAVGSIWSEGGSKAPMAWRSPDGGSWSRATAVQGEGDSSFLTSVVAGGPGFVAGGAGPSTALIWTSVDGQTWTTADRRAFLVQGVDTYGQGEIAAVVAAGPGFVAVGSRAAPGPLGESEGAIFVSPDGVAWESLASDDVVAGTAFTTAVRHAGGLVIAGSERLGGTGGRAAAWTSTDGRSWLEVDPVDLAGRNPHPPAFTRISAAASRGGVLVAVGAAGSERALGDSAGAVWVAAAPGTTLPAATCPVGRVAFATIATMSATDRVACFADRDLTFRAYVTGIDGQPLLWTGPDGVPTDIGLAGRGLGGPSDRVRARWVRLTGHFADAKCASTAPEDFYEPPSQAVLSCQAGFTVTSFRSLE